MITYETSYQIAKEFYGDCLKFHNGDKIEALSETALIKYNPFSPKKELLHREAVIDFCNATI